jgi:hypothetical protein
MNIRHLRPILFFLAVAAIHAEDIKTTDGKILKDATITGNDALGVTVSHSDGIARVAYDKLPEELRKKYNFDPKQAQAQADMERRGAAQRAAEARAGEVANAAAAAAADQEKALAVNAVRIKGRILQATKEGLLVECKPAVPVASGLASIGGGGGVYAPPDPNGKGRPKGVYGTFWIIGHPQQNSKVDNDPIDINGSEEGTYSYTSVAGAARRVKQYKVVKSFK